MGLIRFPRQGVKTDFWWRFPEDGNAFLHLVEVGIYMERGEALPTPPDGYYWAIETAAMFEDVEKPFRLWPQGWYPPQSE